MRLRLRSSGEILHCGSVLRARWAVFSSAVSRGHDIIPELYPAAGEPVIDKPGKGAFYQTDLELMLRNRGTETLLVCGVTTEVCVNTTVREANDRGFRRIVLADCCASYFPEFHDMGLKMIKAQGGIFGSVSASKPVIAMLADISSTTKRFATQWSVVKRLL
jgi:nicotinamidase-related amidase